MRPCRGQFWLHNRCRPLERTGDRLVELATVNHTNWHFKFQDWSWYAKVMEVQSERSNFFHHMWSTYCHIHNIMISIHNNVMWDWQWSIENSQIFPTHATMSWALLTSQPMWTIGSHRRSSRVLSNCESRKLTFLVSKSEFICKSYGRSKRRLNFFSSYICDHIHNITRIHNIVMWDWHYFMEYS